MESAKHTANRPAREGEDITRPVVQKFGGTSMSQLGKVAEIIKATGGPKVAVVSAFSQVTNKLRDMVNAAVEKGGWNILFNGIQGLHAQIIADNNIDGLEEILAPLWRDLLEKVAMVASLDTCSSMVNDFIMSFGEKLSAIILASKLRQDGVEAEAIDAADHLFYCEDNEYGEGTLDIKKTNQVIRKKIGALLGRDIMPVVTGYRAMSKEGSVIALGRGASDYSATIVGAALPARQIQIWTDVSGVMNADPRLVGSDNAKTVDEMTYQEARELAMFGAKVLHPRTLDRPQEEDIPVRVLNTNDTSHPGTVIHCGVEEKALRGVTHQSGFKILKFNSSKVMGRHGTILPILRLFDRYKISYEDMTTNATGVSFSFPDNVEIPDALFEEVPDHFAVDKITDMARISVVGSVINNHANVAHQASGVLVDNDWHWTMVGQGPSGNNFIFYSNTDEAEDIVKALFDELFAKGAQ